MFDLDQGRVSVRLSEYVYRSLTDDMREFSFDNNKKMYNKNAFLNKLLPNLIIYRDSKRDRLSRYIKDNFECCIVPQYRDKVLFSIDGIFDFIYFDDFYETYHTEVLHFRFNKENIPILQKVCKELNETGMKKTAYLRNLLNEYVSMSVYMRQRLLYMKECQSIEYAIRNSLSISLKTNDKNTCCIPIEIKFSNNDHKWHIIILSDNKQLNAIRVCDIIQLELGDCRHIIFSKEEEAIIKDYIENEKFIENSN